MTFERNKKLDEMYALIERLEKENEQLKKLLKKNDICYRCGSKTTLSKGMCHGCNILTNP